MDSSFVRRHGVAFAVATFTLCVSLFGYALYVHAEVSTNAAVSLTSLNQTIKATSPATAVIGFNLVSDSETLASTTIGLIFSASGTTTDIATLGIATSSGVTIYRDDAAGGTNGSFDAADDVIPLSSTPGWTASANGLNATTTLTFATAETVPTDNSGANAGNDYFIVITSAPASVNGHALKAQMIPGGIGWNGAVAAGPTLFQTDVITVDTIAPTVDTTMTGPANNATNVPVSTFIHMGFSENLDQSTLNLTNITFTQGGSAVGAGIRPFPNGFDIVVSNPPTYTASTKFAKVTTVSTGFFHVSGTNAITPQGAYSAPAYGDIVYMQFGTFPPEVGLVTNSVLTSGTFAINGNTLFNPSQVTKFAAPAFATTTSTGSPVGIGDLVVTNTSANPTDVRYNWHIVTTGASINGSGLRLDNASAAPTYPATTTLSKILPAATSTTDSAGDPAATTTVSAGDPRLSERRRRR